MKAWSFVTPSPSGAALSRREYALNKKPWGVWKCWELGTVCGTGTWDQCWVPVLVLVGFCVMLAANNGVGFFLMAPVWKCVILTWQPVGELSLLRWG